MLTDPAAFPMVHREAMGDRNKEDPQEHRAPARLNPMDSHRLRQLMAARMVPPQVKGSVPIDMVREGVTAAIDMTTLRKTDTTPPELGLEARAATGVLVVQTQKQTTIAMLSFQERRKGTLNNIIKDRLHQRTRKQEATKAASKAMGSRGSLLRRSRKKRNTSQSYKKSDGSSKKAAHLSTALYRWPDRPTRSVRLL